MKEYSIRLKVEGVKAANGSDWFRPFQCRRIFKSRESAEAAMKKKVEDFIKYGDVVEGCKIVCREVSEWQDA